MFKPNWLLCEQTITEVAIVRFKCCFMIFIFHSTSLGPKSSFKPLCFRHIKALHLPLEFRGQLSLFHVKQKQKPQQQKPACRLDKEGDAIWAAFKAHTFRLDSRVSSGSQRRIHLQAAVVKIEAAAQIARIPTNQHGGDYIWNLLIYRIHSAESVCVCVCCSCGPDEAVGHDTTVLCEV